MATTLQTKTTLMNIPQIVEGVFYALESEDYEELEVLKNDFYTKYENFGDDLKPHVRSFLKQYITANELDPIKDLNNFFGKVFTQK